jgi:hypothetical protein
MSLTKVSYSMIEGSQVNVLDFGAVGNGSTDDTAAIQAAIAYGKSLYQKEISGQGNAFPAKVATVVFPVGIYVVSSTITLVDADYKFCNLQGNYGATLLYTAASGVCLNASAQSADDIVVVPMQIEGLKIMKLDKATGSVGLLVQRISNCYFKALEFWGFDYAIKNYGGISNIYDFKGRSVFNCNVGMLITAQKAPTGIPLPTAPNLTNVVNGYFISCSTNAIQIIVNPDEPTAIVYRSGGVISIRDTNFQDGASGASVLIENPGEIANNGTVSFERCWWEGYGVNAVRLVSGGTAVLNNCFIAGGLAPLVLGSAIARFVLQEGGSYFATPTTSGTVVSRSDGNTSEIIGRVWSRNFKVYNDYIGPTPVTVGPNFGADNIAEFWGVLVGRNAALDPNSIKVGNGLGACVGVSNIAIGTNAMQNAVVNGYSTAVGTEALRDSISGDRNNAFGFTALAKATTASDNCAFGWQAMLNTTTGAVNTAYGNYALGGLTTASNNVSIGLQSLLFNNANNNTAIGYKAGYADDVGSKANITGSNNTFIGYNSQGSAANISDTITLGNSAITTLRCQVTTITSLSDARDKTNVQELPVGVGFLNKLRPVSFIWNTRDGAKVGAPDFGFLAQELVQAQDDAGIQVPNLVCDVNPEKLEAGYSALLPVLVKAIQELSAQISELQMQLNKK